MWKLFALSFYNAELDAARRVSDPLFYTLAVRIPQLFITKHTPHPTFSGCA